MARRGPADDEEFEIAAQREICIPVDHSITISLSDVLGNMVTEGVIIKVLAASRLRFSGWCGKALLLGVRGLRTYVLNWAGIYDDISCWHGTGGGEPDR